MTDSTLNIDRIAELAGVSRTTVSRVLNNRPDVNRATRQRVLEVIEQHDFHPNAFAKAISSQKSHNIGLVIPYEADYIFLNPFFVEVLRGISSTIDRAGYSLLVSYTHGEDPVVAYRRKKVDGFLILSPSSLHHGLIEAMSNAGTPFVSTSRLADEETMIYVDVDNVAGGRLAAEHLLDLGHRHIAYVGKPSLTSSQDRLEGVRLALSRHGLDLDPALVLEADGHAERHGHDAVRRLLRQPERPTAIFLANDMMAIGAVQAIEEAGLRVPQDISVVGFDDVPLAQYLSPPLTTVHQPAFEKGARAAHLLLQCLENEECRPQSAVLDVHLVVRRSTAAVAA
ncbi:MAG: LacI family DNA-binding transcriptional regulator [Caldilineaceae bacterium]